MMRSVGRRKHPFTRSRVPNVGAAAVTRALTVEEHWACCWAIRTARPGQRTAASGDAGAREISIVVHGARDGV